MWRQRNDMSPFLCCLTFYWGEIMSYLGPSWSPERVTWGPWGPEQEVQAGE